MTGLDTNILLRYLTADDSVQYLTAKLLMEETLSAENPGFVSLVTISELVWTLKKTFKLTNQSVGTVVDGLLSTRRIVLQNEYEVFLAVVSLADGFDFADALVAALGQWSGCSHTLTFDRRASRLPGMHLI